MTRRVVEVGFGSTVTTPAASIVWTELTSRLDDNLGITIDRGRQDEQSQIQASICSATFDNSDGALTAGRASSPYYPNVKKGVPIRVREITTAKNLLTDPSFETGVSSWTSSGTPTRATSTTHVQHGTQAMLITWGAVANQTMTSPVIQGLDVGQTYTYSTYVWVPAGDATVQLSVAGGNIGAANTLFDTFQRITVTWTATATSHQVRVRAVGTPAAGDQVWVDAGQIEEGSAATTFDPDGAQVHDRFWGSVNAWPTKWKGLHATATITATDVFKQLAKPQMQTMLTEETLLDEPLAYYPMAEPSGSTSAGDMSGSTAGVLTQDEIGSGGTLDFSSGDAGPDGQGALVLTPVNASNGKFLTGDLGEDFAREASDHFVFIEGWFSTTTVSRVICGLTSASNRYQVVLSLNGSGAFTVETTATGEALTASPAGTPNLADGQQHHFVYDEEAQTVWVDGVSYAIGADITIGLRRLTVGAFTNSRCWAGQLSHITLYAPGPSGDIAQYVAHYTTGTTGHSVETAMQRASRIASYVGYTVTASGAGFGAVGSQAALGGSPLSHLQEVEQAEGGVLVSSRGSAALTLQSRDVRYNPTPGISLSHADLDTDEAVFDDDDQKQINDASGSRPGGATQRVRDTASIAAYGPYPKPMTLVKATDAEVVDALQWTVNRYADPPPELRQVPIDAYTLPLATYRALLNADVSTVFGITDLPAEAPTSTTTVTVEGYKETIKRRQHYLNFHTSRTDTDTVWVLNDATYSVLGQSTRLAY
ncbi:carbohydrate binding domain-containing protein [Streptomyces sp. NPDC087659]|uniref:phage head spike fiber domain-containing protein n=1 Tax=Streptomyces sp. NPDC087659 TaxID=3365801 RepID=UPI00382630C0